VTTLENKREISQGEFTAALSGAKRKTIFFVHNRRRGASGGYREKFPNFLTAPKFTIKIYKVR
jgi:hypothetical protein